VADLHPAVAGVAMVGMPVRVQSSSEDVSSRVDSFIKAEMYRYIRKTASAAAWKRFMTLQTDYRTFLAVLVSRTRALMRRQRRVNPDVNAIVLQSFRRALSPHRRLLFVYGENDYLWTEFRELFLATFPLEESGFELTTIQRANHTFTDQESQEALFARLVSWVGAIKDGAET
jgi:hypothetical protein